PATARRLRPLGLRAARGGRGDRRASRRRSRDARRRGARGDVGCGQPPLIWTRCAQAGTTSCVADKVEEGGGRELRSFMEIIEPEGSKSTLRDLPHLLAASFRLVWSAGRR